MTLDSCNKVYIAGADPGCLKGGGAKFGPAHILYINGARARPSHEQNRTRTSELLRVYAY